MRCSRPTDETIFMRQIVDDLCQGFFLLAPFYSYLTTLAGSAR